MELDFLNQILGYIPHLLPDGQTLNQKAVCHFPYGEGTDCPQNLQVDRVLPSHSQLDIKRKQRCPENKHCPHVDVVGSPVPNLIQQVVRIMLPHHLTDRLLFI